MSRTAFRFLVVCLMAVALVRPAVAAGCTDKAKCMQCLLPDALINQSLVLTLYAGDACTWPGVSCDSRGNVVSVVVKHQVKNFFPQCVPDTVTSLSIAGLGLLVFTTWLGHASLQTLDISGNRYACVISGQSGTKVPDACFGLIGQFPALQTVTTNVMSAVGFNVTFQDLPNLLTVIADSGTSVGQLYVRNCPNLISVRLRGLGGYFVVTDQRYAAAAPTPVMGGQSVAASVIQGGTSLTTVSCIDCPLLAAAFSCATLKSLTLTGANFGTAVASNVALAQFSDTLVTGAPQLLYLPGLLISNAAALTSINVTSSKLGCFDFDLPSLAVMCVAMNNISGWITSSRPPSSSVFNRTCPFWGPSQRNWQSSVVLRQLVANDNRLSIVDKSSVYSTLDFINLANNQLAAVFFCNQPCSYVDVWNNPTLQGDVCTLRSQLPAAAFVNSTRSCCGGAVGSAIEFSSAIGGQSSVQCVCSSPLTPPDDYSNCTAAATYTTATDKCTAQASFYDPAQNPSTSDKPIFRDAVFTTRKRADGTYDLVMSNVTLSSDSFPVFVPSGRFVVGVDALLTRDALAYTLASSSNFAFRFAFNNGAPDAWQPANKWIATLNPATCRMEYAYRIDPANLVNDSFVTVTRSGNTYTVVVDVTFMEALPVLLSNNTFVHYDARRVTYTLQFTIAPPVLPMCGALLRGNLDATNASGVRLLIVNYASVGVSNLSATPVNQQPSGFFSQCVPYNPPPSLQGVACQGGALTSALTASATITLRGTSASGLPVTCSYPFAAQIQPPVSVVTPQTPGGGTPTTTVPRGSFQGTCGSNPANADTTVIYVIAGSATVIITITQPVTGLSVVVTDQPNMFNVQQVYDALRGETTVSFNPIAALQFYPWMYTESSVVLSVKSAASSRRQTSSANPDQYSLTLSTAVTQSAASALTTAAPPTAAPPTTTSSPPTTTPPTTSPITSAPTGAPTTATSTTGAPTTTRTPATTGAPATTTNAPPTTTAAPTTTTSTATTTARAPTTTNASTTVPATTTGAAATTTAPSARNASAPTNASTTVAPTADANVTNSTTAANATLGPLPTAINGQQPTTTQSPLQTVMDGPSPTTTPAPPPNGRSKVSTAPSLGGRGTSIVVALLCVVSIFHV